MKGFKEIVTNLQFNRLHYFGIVKAETIIFIENTYTSS